MFTDRIQRYTPETCEFIRLDECALDGICAHDYKGAGQAIIAVKGDVIIRLEYGGADGYTTAQAERWAQQGYDVWFGTCSCITLCNPIKLDNPLDQKSTRKQIKAHAEKHNFIL